MPERVIEEINYDASMQKISSFRVKRTPDEPVRSYGPAITVGDRVACWCGSTSVGGWGQKDGAELVRCVDCGTGRVSRMSVAMWEQYRSGNYHMRPPRGEKPFHERFKEDFDVARQRLTRLNLYTELGGKRLLDVGSGNGAFVQAALELASADAWGCDLSTAGIVGASREAQGRIRKGDLAGSGHTRRSLDVITMLDVLEHTVDPVQQLEKAAILLRRGGLLAVELPDCGTAEAINQGLEFKHVKPNEHVWYWTEAQFRGLAERAGFFPIAVERPIDGKMVFYLAPVPKREKIRVIGPPGIGDMHWILLKVRDLVRQEAPCELTVVVNAKGDPHHAHRSREYMEMIPWIDNIEFAQEDLVQDLGAVDPFSGVYHLIVNEHLEHGKRLETWRPEFKVDWNYEIEVSDADTLLAQRIGDMAGGGLAVFYMSSNGWNVACSGTGRLPWGPVEWASLARRIKEKFGFKPVLIGKDWDGDFLQSLIKLLAEEGESFDALFVNMIGKTSVGLASALMAESKVTVGMCAGITILGVHLGAPSIMFWPEQGISKTARMQFHPDFQTDWVAPEVLESGRYVHRSLGKFKVDDVFKDVQRLVGG